MILDDLVDNILNVAEPVINLALKYWYVTIIGFLALLLWVFDLVKYIPFIGGL